MELIDCHAHLADALFDADRREVLERARAAGVTRVVTVGETLDDARRNLRLAGEHAEILPAAGLYPTHLDLEQAERMESLIRAHRERLVAIGEVGLDHWKVKEPADLEIQHEIFRRFVRLSLELDLPLNIHSRSAGRQAVALLLDEGARRVQLHAFDGRPASAQPAVEAGWFFSIPPSVVRSRQKQKLVRRLPLDCLLLETDSPVLGAAPGQRNEPAEARVSLRAIAELKERSEDEVAEAVTANARRLFGSAAGPEGPLLHASASRPRGRRSWSIMARPPGIPGLRLEGTMSDPIYLDYNATTPVAPEVVEAVLPALRELWGNPSSGHLFGRRAARALDRARGQVASLLGAEAGEIVFTSGGTESDNAAIVGVAEALADRGREIVTCSIEHPAVDEACAYLERRGWSVTRVPVDSSGRVETAELASALGERTVLVTIMHANNETGVVQPIRKISGLTRARGIVLHTDAAQSVGKLPVSVDDLGVDLLTLAGHKLYAPKGVGALYIRRGTPFGGFLRGAGHESGRRSGTENTPQIVGLGAACALAERELPQRRAHLGAMRDRLEAALREVFPDLVVHGASAERLPNTLSAAIPGVDAHRLLERLEGVATAAGAACHAGRSEPSDVLRAMGVADDLAVCTLRLTTGRSTTPDEIDNAASEIVRAARSLGA